MKLPELDLRFVLVCVGLSFLVLIDFTSRFLSVLIEAGVAIALVCLLIWLGRKGVKS